MIYLILVSLVWAFSFPLIKGHLTTLDPNFVSLARMILSLLVFLPFLRLRGLERPLGLKLAFIGAVQFGLMYIAYITAFQFLPAHTIVLMTTTTPLFVTLFNDVSSRRVNVLFFVAALLAFLGGAVIKYPAQPLRSSLTGILLIQLSNMAFAFGQLYYKKLSARHRSWRDRSVFGFLYGGGVMITALFALVRTEFSRIQITASQVVVLVYLGIIASGVCFFLWNKGTRFVNEGMLAIMNNLKIPLGVIASLILLGERTDYVRLVLGFGLMVGAAYLCERPGRLLQERHAGSRASKDG